MLTPHFFNTFKLSFIQLNDLYIPVFLYYLIFKVQLILFVIILAALSQSRHMLHICRLAATFIYINFILNSLNTPLKIKICIYILFFVCLQIVGCLFVCFYTNIYTLFEFYLFLFKAFTETDTCLNNVYINVCLIPNKVKLADGRHKLRQTTKNSKLNKTEENRSAFSFMQTRRSLSLSVCLSLSVVLSILTLMSRCNLKSCCSPTRRSLCSRASRDREINIFVEFVGPHQVAATRVFFFHFL